MSRQQLRLLQALLILGVPLAGGPVGAVPVQFAFTGTVTSNLGVTGAPVGSTVTGHFSYDSDATGVGTSLSRTYSFADVSPPYGIVASFDGFVAVGSADGASVGGFPSAPGAYTIRVDNGTFSDVIRLGSSIEDLGYPWGSIFTGFSLELRASPSLLPSPTLPTSLSLGDLNSAVLTLTAIQEVLVHGQLASVTLWEVKATLTALANEPFTPLPEPATGLLVLLGLAGLAAGSQHARAARS